MSHTPTPWATKVKHGGPVTGVEAEIAEMNDCEPFNLSVIEFPEIGAEIVWDNRVPGRTERALADAELIRRAVNSHDALVSALEEATLRLEALGQDTSQQRAALDGRAELTPLHVKLLRRGMVSEWIGLSDDMGTRMGEVTALGELHRMGFVERAKEPFPPGPPSPTPFIITEAGRAALREHDPGRPVPPHGSGP